MIELSWDYYEVRAKIDNLFKQNPTFSQALQNIGCIYIMNLYTVDVLNRERASFGEKRKVGTPARDLVTGAKNSLKNLLNRSNNPNL